MAPVRYIPSSKVAARIAQVFGKFRLGTSQGHDTIRLEYPNGFIEFRRNRSDFLSIAAGPLGGPVLVHCALEHVVKIEASRKQKSVRLTCESSRGRTTTIYVGSLRFPDHGFFDIQLNRIPFPRPPRILHRLRSRTKR